MSIACVLNTCEVTGDGDWCVGRYFVECCAGIFSGEFLRTATPLVSLYTNNRSRIFHQYDYINFEG
ncbi:hypothetical protein [Lysinibacillus sphaericus]|uniref:hypothetical protein n=1 Tax=Lysinibacillus sphaericus TaxID=1421 RepID=UPI0018CF4A92|nr:hypothetical protein [Lysinibacillus sphaericus]